MNEAEIKRWLQREVNAPDSELLWRWLEEDHYTAMLQDSEIGWEEFVEEAGRLATRQREAASIAGGYSGRRPGRPEPEPGEIVEPWEMEPDSYAVEMARTYSAHLAIWASKRVDVKHFRDSVLGDDLLSTEQVMEFVNASEYREHGPARELEYLDETGKMQRIRVRAHSPADHLRRVSGKLQTSYPWTEAQAAAFILTGEPPEVPPMVGYSRDDGISISASPWVSQQEVSRFYHHLQRRVRGDKDNRPVSERARDVLLLVSEHTSGIGEHPGWGELLRLWNVENPEHAFGDRAGFMRAYRRAYKALLSKEPPHKAVRKNDGKILFK